MSEREKCVVVTQIQYIADSDSSLPKSSGAKVGDKMLNLARNLSFGAIPQCGAYELAGYAVEAGYDVQLANLLDPRTPRVCEEAAVVLLSTMDIGLTHTARILENLGARNGIAAGGYGVTPIASELADKFPWVTFVQGDGRGITREVLKDISTNNADGGVRFRSEVFDMSRTSEEPFMQAEIWKKISGLFGRTPVKSVQASEGCNESCDFCPTAGVKPRYIPLEVLKSQIERYNMNAWDLLVFTDQNLCVLPRDYILELFDWINHKNIHHIFEGTLGYFRDRESGKWDEEVLAKMGAKCLFCLGGLEDVVSPTPGSPIKNSFTKEGYLEELLEVTRRNKLPFLGSMVFGTDQQEYGYAETAAEKVLSTGLTVANHLATPRPGTNFWRKVVAGNRMLDWEPSHRNLANELVYKPLKMEREQAIEDFILFNRLVHAPAEVLKRFEKNLKYGPRYAMGLMVPEVVYMLGVDYLVNRYPEISAHVEKRLGKE